MFYIVRLARGEFDGTDGAHASAAFNDFLGEPWSVLLWHTVFIAVTVFIVARGVVRGLEVAVRWLMPLLFALLIALVGYAAIYGDFAQGWNFLFSFEVDKLSVGGVLTAMGHAFFTLSLGMGAIMAYGAYVPASTSIGTTAVTIAVLDTVVALAAGLAIFPIVFATAGLEPGAGSWTVVCNGARGVWQFALGCDRRGGVLRLGELRCGHTSAISLTEPALAFLVEEYNAKRARVAVTIGAACWLLGIGSVLSFNVWADVHIVGGLTFFDFVDYVSGKILLPLGGLLIALFAGWVLPKAIAAEQLGLSEGWKWLVWTVAIRFVAPVGVVIVFAYTIYESIA